MKLISVKTVWFLLFLSIYVSTMGSTFVWACACGCGVFDVGTSSMFPMQKGDTLFVEYDYQHQDRNWRGSHSEEADHNEDKKIITHFFTLGYQHMFDSRWGVMATLPYWNRYFKTTTEEGDVTGFSHAAVGDIRLLGIYTGLSPNMATGITFGVKLPSGDYTYPNFDPDTEIGTGSTDLLVGGYHRGEWGNSHWSWFTQTQASLPIIHARDFVPGSQVDASLGAYYDAWSLHGIKIAPLAQVIVTHRWADSGDFALVPGSGYSRVLLAPGLEFDVAAVRIYTDIGFPVYQYTIGNQLIASQFFKLNVSYHF